MFVNNIKFCIISGSIKLIHLIIFSVVQASSVHRHVTYSMTQESMFFCCHLAILKHFEQGACVSIVHRSLSIMWSELVPHLGISNYVYFAFSVLSLPSFSPSFI